MSLTVVPPFSTKSITALTSILFVSVCVFPAVAVFSIVPFWMFSVVTSVSNVIMNQAKDGKIVLCHDLYSSTAQAMKIVVPKLVEQGYDLVTVTELLESKGGKVKAGQVYFSR